jgi:hypothetical protein
MEVVELKNKKAQLIKAKFPFNFFVDVKHDY